MIELFKNCFFFIIKLVCKEFGFETVQSNDSGEYFWRNRELCVEYLCGNDIRRLKDCKSSK